MAILYLLTVTVSCKKLPYVPDYDHAGGIVIGKETCSSTDPDNDHWLIDLNVNYTAINNFGDTLTYNGIFYEHVVKTKGLLAAFKTVGKKLAFDCHFSAGKIITTGCTVALPVNYALKEMQVITTFER